VIELPLLRDRRLAHGFFTRAGGVSGGIYASLNCGFGSSDDRSAVAQNRARAAHRLGVDETALRTVHQVHGRSVVTAGPGAGAAWSPTAAPKADAMVTREPGVALGILTADCAPVLLADPDARVIGAAHAGWRGALDGVLEAAVEAMLALGAARGRIRAAIGPCIAQDSYEVGSDFPAPFLARDPADARFFTAGRDGRHQFDLSGYAAMRLRATGCTVEVMRIDTYAEPELCFSYRRATHRGEPDYGRQIAAIALTG
jgi:polyphenol oxidase